MILTCPECASRYFVADDAVPPGGRTVRCASCGANWRALPQADDVLELSASPDEAPAPRSRREAAPAPVPPVISPELPGEALPRAYRERVQAKKQAVKAATAGVAWAIAGAVLVVLLAGAIIFRASVVRMWPRTASAYAAVGLGVNPTGLTFENVRAEPDLAQGRPAVVVSGAIRNVVEDPVSPPAVRIALLDAGGRELAVKIADPGSAVVPAGETRRFSVSLFDPPQEAKDVSVAFVVEGRETAQAAAHE